VEHVSHEWLEKFLKHRIADTRVLRLIQKWMKAGVLEDGERLETEQGTPQGAVVRKNNSALRISTIWAIGSDVRSTLRIGRIADVT